MRLNRLDEQVKEKPVQFRLVQDFGCRQNLNVLHGRCLGLGLWGAPLLKVGERHSVQCERASCG